MGKKVNISKIEGLLKKAGLDNGELDDLIQPVKDLNNQRRYGLVWEEPDNETFEKDFAEEDLSLNFPFISELKDKEIYHGEDHPDHLLIEGDNLHALQMMQYTHKNKVDVIYIDPPYNTGNTDFVYNDKIVDNEDSWRHSKWLSFMNKRLRLARELMTDEGVIFVSIDDNELYQLKLLMDQIFGEENFITDIKWRANPRGRTTSKFVGKVFENILMYSLNIEKFKIKDKKVTDVKKIRQYKYEDAISKFKKGYPLHNGTKDFHIGNRPNLTYAIYYNPDTGDAYTRDEKYMKDGELYINREGNKDGGYYRIVPKYNEMYDRQRVWRWQQSTFMDKYATEIMFEKEGNSYYPYGKDRLDKGVLYEKHKDFIDSIYTDNGTREIYDIGLRDKFNFPKPVDLIKSVVVKHPNKNATVLDFFAGSGTTGQAVMELNEEDGGNRQAILVTNNEVADKEERDKMVELGLIQPFTGSRRGTIKHREWLADIEEFKTTEAYQDFINSDDYKDLGIARAVTYPRNQKVIVGYTTPKGKDIDGLYRNNFRHFVIELVEDLQDDNLNAYHLIEKTTDIIRLKESVYSNVEFVDADGIPFAILSNKYTEIFVILDSMVFDEDIEKIIATYSTEGQEKVLYSNYDKFNYSDHDIRFEELPKELLQAIKQKEVE